MKLYNYSKDQIKEMNDEFMKNIRERIKIVNADLELVEDIAQMMHDQWAHWTNYFLSNLTVENLNRWKEQASIPYSDLTEEDKDKDRKWAMKYLKVLLLHGYNVKNLEELQEKLSQSTVTTRTTKRA